MDYTPKGHPGFLATYPFGILFVHGIGEQGPADTLLQFGDPFIRWIDRWLGRKPGGTVPVGATRICAARTVTTEAADVPAHADLELIFNLPDGHPGASEHWLLAEARWASEVRTPPFRHLASWMLTTGAWIILSHALRSARSQASSRWRWLKVTQALIVALIVTPLLQLSVVLLMVLGVLPIPALRSALSAILLRASGILGDSYVLLESPVQRQAIVDSVRRSLSWLAGRCDKVAVIAHSQGAAVAHRALRDPRPGNVCLLVTYGSGLAKVEELEVMGSRHRDKLNIARFGVPLFLVAILLTLRVTSAYSADPWAIRALMWCLVPLMMVWLAVTVVWEDWPQLGEWLHGLSLRHVRSDLDWLDLYASADPVPNGPLTFGRSAVEGVDSRVVTNLKSLVNDHTTYWQNEAEFIPQVIARIERHCGFNLLGIGENGFLARGRLADAERTHVERVRWLLTVRWVTFASAMVFLIMARSHLPQLGRLMLDALRQPPLDPVGTLVSGVGHTAINVMRWSGTGGDADVRRYGLALLGALVVGGVFALWQRMFYAVWAGWERMHVGNLFLVRGSPRHPIDRAFVGALVIGVGFWPAAVTAASVFVPSMFDQPLQEVVIYRVLGGAAVTVVWLVLVIGIAMRVKERNTDQTPLREFVIGALAIGGGAILFTPSLLPGSIWDALKLVGLPVLALASCAEWQAKLAREARQTIPRHAWWLVWTPAAVVLAWLAAMLVFSMRSSPPTGHQSEGTVAIAVGAFGIYATLAVGGEWALSRVRRRRERAASAGDAIS